MKAIAKVFSKTKTEAPSNDAAKCIPVETQEEREARQRLHLRVREYEDAAGHLRIVCSCGVHFRGERDYTLHVEQYDYILPIAPAGWPQRHFELIPNASLVQQGVVARVQIPYALFTTIHLKDNESLAAIRSCLAGFQAAWKLYEGVVGYCAVSAELWGKLDPNPPVFLKPLETKRSPDGERILFPGTGGELFFLIKGQSAGICVEATDKALQPLTKAGIVESMDQVNGFVYNGGRDLTGFIDGTRNPDHLLRAVIDETVIFEEDEMWATATGDHKGSRSEAAKAHAGGSYIFAGRFVHDLPKFAGMTCPMQSAIIGRDISRVEPHFGYDPRPENPKLEDIPIDSHISRSHGAMFRQAYPFIEGNRKGLFFTAAARNLEELDNALDRMCGADGRGVDQLFKITHCTQSAYFYAPSIRELARMGEPSTAEPQVEDEKEVPAEAGTSDQKEEEEQPELKVYIEFCTNCGYSTIYYEKSAVLRAVYPKVKIIGNPDRARQSSFEIWVEDTEKSGFVRKTFMWQKLKLRDGHNNYPQNFPDNTTLAETFKDLLDMRGLKAKSLPEDFPKKSKYGAHGMW